MNGTRVVALGVLLLLAQPVHAQATCDPTEAATLRAHLERESDRARNWNIIWAAVFGTAAIGSLTVAVTDAIPELTTSMYVSSGKASIGAFGRLILPLRIPLPPIDNDPCVDIANLHKAIKEAARRERGNFYLNHLAGILVNGAGAMIIWKYDTGGKAALSVATGYPVGLLSNYTAPRASWHMYRDADWSVTVTPPQSAANTPWMLTLGGGF